jgi:ppGpp synthetase/RelA/SpoT-type nucleotidyltranferase
MGFVEPQHDDETVDIAGDALTGDADATQELEERNLSPLDVINNFRSAHAYPLNTFQPTLRERAGHVCKKPIVAQRIKRLTSIKDKLERYPDLKLSTIQDVGGGRVIVDSVPQVYKIVERYKAGYSVHELIDERDYIKGPKSDGYRSYHLIYRYRNKAHSQWDGLRVELQFRSNFQHIWATAVETADIFYSEGLKSHRGLPEWRRFFALMGTHLAMREHTRLIPRTPKDARELKEELRECAKSLDVARKLGEFGKTLNVVGPTVRKEFRYLVLLLNPQAPGAPTTTIYGYKTGALDDATQKLAILEQYKEAAEDAVLVSVSDATMLRRAYPNYYLDTALFMEALTEAIS